MNRYGLTCTTPINEWKDHSNCFTAELNLWIHLIQPPPPPSPAVVHTESITDNTRSVCCYLRIRWIQTFWHRLPIFQVDLHCAPHRVATSSCSGHVDELATEPFLLLQLKLLRSTDSFRRDLKTFLFYSVYGHQDTDWLCDACALGLLVGGAIQVPQLQLLLHHWTNANVVSHRWWTVDCGIMSTDQTCWWRPCLLQGTHFSARITMLEHAIYC